MDIEEYKKKMAECGDASEMLKVWREYTKDTSNAEERDAILRYNKYSVDHNYFEEAFNKYLMKDTLKVMNEAIPLILGVLPSDWSKLRNRFNYGHHIFERIESDKYGSLEVINGDKRKGLWRVKTKDFFKWADAKGLLKPKGLIETIKNTKGLINKPKGAKSEKSAVERETLLKAALYVIKNYGDQCYHGKNISANKVAKLIDEKCDLWWHDGYIPFERSSMEKILQGAFKLPKE